MNLFVFLALLIGCCAYAFARGGAPERIAAGLQLAAFAIDEIVHRLVDGSAYTTLAIGSAVNDVVLLIALILLAWRSTRFWPLWLAGWQAAAIIGHLARLIDPGMQAVGYAVQAQIWAYPMLIAMAAGTWRHHQRVRGGDPDRSWKAVSV